MTPMVVLSGIHGSVRDIPTYGSADGHVIALEPVFENECNPAWVLLYEQGEQVDWCSATISPTTLMRRHGFRLMGSEAAINHELGIK